MSFLQLGWGLEKFENISGWFGRHSCAATLSTVDAHTAKATVLNPGYVRWLARLCGYETE